MPKIKFTHPLRVYALRYRVSMATIKRWSAQGLNLDDARAVSLNVSCQKHQPEDFETEASQDNLVAQTVAVLEAGLREFDGVTKIIASGKNAEGCNRKETVTSHQRLINCMLTRFWKRTIRAMNGEQFEAFKDSDELFPQ